MSTFCRFLTIFIASLLVFACAKKPSDPDLLAIYEQNNDPLEPLNRFVWDANQMVDTYTLRPIAKGYRATTPEPFRIGVRNAYDNLSEPWSFINNLLQGNFKRAGKNLGRLVINSTVGIGGLYDAATDFGLSSADEDLGQTFATWGIGPGPFLMLPVLGPSNPRDFVGFIGQGFGDPINVVLRAENLTYTNIGLSGGQILVQREQVLGQLESIVTQSQDSYAAIRSAYRQNREFLIYNGNPPIEDEFDPFAEEF